MNEQKIIDMYKEKKMSTYEIAKALNTYPNKIRRLLIKHGVELNDKSTAQKLALEKGIANIPTKGKTRTREEKLKISRSLKDNWENIGDKEYAKRVELAKDRWSKLSQSAKTKMNEAAIQAIQKAGKEGSKLEKFIRNELSQYGYKVESHKKNLIPNYNLEIDMYFPEVKAIIEIDGPSHFLPIWGEEKLKKQIKADADKTGLILSRGLAIIRVKNLSDSLSLASQENLKTRLINILDSMKNNFPKESERYIEIEV
jgi:very-short-patch-repair endonuclease